MSQFFVVVFISSLIFVDCYTEVSVHSPIYLKGQVYCEAPYVFLPEAKATLMEADLIMDDLVKSWKLPVGLSTSNFTQRLDPVEDGWLDGTAELYWRFENVCQKGHIVVVDNIYQRRINLTPPPSTRF
uniref:Uncharacterized protein n=1 Tax=Panagrolaimus sp. JU765 TaxID=591449 RepID=A0AC34QMG7_9BILA